MEGEAKGFWRAIGEEGYKLVKDDPRRVAHAGKVGLATTALSLLYYYGVLFQASGVDGLLTITTVMGVFEYTVAFGGVYFQESHEDDIEALKDYKSVLEYKAKEDSLVNFARWEPRHKKFRCYHPWDQYLVIGSATRECAYKIEALNFYLVSDVQTPLELRMKIRDLCTDISFECGLALKEVAAGLRTMKSSLYSEIHIADAKAAAETLKGLLETEFWYHGKFLDAVPAVVMASQLIEIVACTAKIIDSVEVLSTEAKFEKPDPTLNAVVEL